MPNSPADPADRRQALGWLIVVALFGSVFWLLSPILTPFLIAGLLAYVTDPLVERLAARRVPRMAGAGLVVVGLSLALLAFLLVVAPLFIEQSGRLLNRLPSMIERANTSLAPWLATQLGVELQFDLAHLKQALTADEDSLRNLAGRLATSLKLGGMAALGILTNLLLVPLVALYLLADWPRIVSGCETLVPRRALALIRKLAAEVDAVLSEFLRGQLSVMLLLAAFYVVALSLAGLDFALPIGLITGLLVFVPYVGFGSGLVLGLLSALLQGDGYTLLLVVGGVFLAGQLIESFLLTPYLVGDRIGLHPVAVIFALMAFGQLFGFVGILIALPASACLLVGLRALRTHYLQGDFYNRVQ